MLVRLGICTYILNHKRILVFISYFETFCILRCYHSDKIFVFGLVYVFANICPIHLRFGKTQPKHKYDLDKQQIVVFSESPNPNPNTNVHILKITNQNMAICLCLGSKTPPKLWYPNIFVPKYAPP